MNGPLFEGLTAGGHGHQLIAIFYFLRSLYILCFISQACAIEEEQTVTITGGAWRRSKIVKRYKKNGKSESLPALNRGRQAHACGYFTNTRGDIVSKTYIVNLASIESYI